MFMEAGEGMTEEHEALVGTLPIAVEGGFPKGCVANLEEIVLGECLGAFLRVLSGSRYPAWSQYVQRESRVRISRK